MIYEQMVIHHTSYTRKTWFKIYRELEDKNRKLKDDIKRLCKENINLKERIKIR